VTEIVGEAVAERIAGGRPSRTRTFVAATTVALTAFVLTYKALRS
jgi:hypothetical protein